MSASPTPTSVLTRSKPTQRDAMALWSRELLAALACAQSGTIQAFYPGPPQTADVAFNSAIVVGYQSDSKGQTSPILRPYPLLPNVPVIVIGGGGGAITFPIQKGDEVLLLFLDRDQDSWLTTGQTGLPPNTNRLHALSDAVAIVGLRNAKTGLVNYSATDAQFYGPDGVGGPIVSLGEGKVRISNASQDLRLTLDALMTSLADLIAALKAWVDTRGDTPSVGTKLALDAVNNEFTNVKDKIDDLFKSP